MTLDVNNNSNVRTISTVPHKDKSELTNMIELREKSAYCGLSVFNVCKLMACK